MNDASDADDSEATEEGTCSNEHSGAIISHSRMDVEKMLLFGRQDCTDCDLPAMTLEDALYHIKHLKFDVILQLPIEA